MTIIGAVDASNADQSTRNEGSTLRKVGGILLLVAFVILTLIHLLFWQCKQELVKYQTTVSIRVPKYVQLLISKYVLFLAPQGYLICSPLPRRARCLHHIIGLLAILLLVHNRNCIGLELGTGEVQQHFRKLAAIPRHGRPYGIYRDFHLHFLWTPAAYQQERERLRKHGYLQPKCTADSPISSSSTGILPSERVWRRTRSVLIQCNVYIYLWPLMVLHWRLMCTSRRYLFFSFLYLISFFRL